MARDNGYHKEDLRGDLVKAGLAYVREHGHASLSVRTLAQEVGVSPGAPYHHFPDRRSLLLAIAVEGFKLLIGQGAAVARRNKSGLSQLKALGTSFVVFSDQNPKLTELMYESELANPPIDPELERLHDSGQALIRSAIVSELPRTAARNIDLRAVAFWASIYGLAALKRKSNVQSFETFNMSPDAVTKAVVSRAAAQAIAN